MDTKPLRHGPDAVLTRQRQTADGTYGVLTVGGEQIAYTLELPWRDNHPETSCVPAGTYPVTLEFSPHFGRVLWELRGVPGRSECKFHPANVPSELRGCIALGDAFADFDGVEGVVASRHATGRLMDTYDGYETFTLTIVAPEGVSNVVG
jgi:hypothetical protein